MLNNRILIASPCFGKVDPEILEDWMAFIYHCGRRMPEYEFFLGIKTKSEQFRARNVIVEAAQQQNCDRILMIDDDMIIDAFGEGKEAYRFLEKLIAHDKPICGILYHQRGSECQPVLMTKLNQKSYRFLNDDEVLHQLQKVDVAGGGCLLIQTRIFDRIPYPYFAPEHEYGTDVQLCRRAEEKGFDVWADTSIEFGHMRNEKTIITSRNRHIFQTEPTPAGAKVTFVASEIYDRLTADAMEYTGKANMDEIEHEVSAFMELRKESKLSDADWYREFPKERVCRQVWYNTAQSFKKKMTQFILGAVPSQRPLRILDFGCGIGLTAFTLAEKGHQVTAMDIRGTGTLEFLKWRAAKYGVPMTILESSGDVPDLSDTYDIIIAMDCLEHIQNWKSTLKVLSRHLRADGMLYSNNAILDDMNQPEHYPLRPKDFISECVHDDLMPFTQISYMKREVPVHA